MSDLTQIPKEQLTLICPRNDLESDAILQIAKSENIHTIEHSGEWGAKLDLSSIDISTLKEHVAIIELPNQAAEGSLAQANKQLHIIDHHKYSELDRSSPLSSIEQFAKLIGYSLDNTPYEDDITAWEIAINDRGFIPELCNADVSYEKMLRIREAEHKIKNGYTEEKYQAAQVTYEQKKRSFHDLELCKSSDEYKQVMLDIAQTPTKKAYEAVQKKGETYPTKQVIILYYDKDNPNIITQVELAGGDNKRKHLGSIMNDPKIKRDFQVWSGGDFGFFFGAEPIEGHPNPDIDYLISKILSLFLITGRPVRNYNCTFYLPLDLKLDDELGDPTLEKLQLKQSKYIEQHHIEQTNVAVQQTRHSKEAEAKNQEPEFSKRQREQKEAEAQAYEYLHRHRSDQIFTQKNKDQPYAIEHWKVKDKYTEEMKLGFIDDDKTQQEYMLNVENVSLYKHNNDLMLLAIRVAMDTSKLAKSSFNKASNDWWHDLFNEGIPSNEILNLQVENWLRYSKVVRILYPSFREQLKEDKFKTLKLSGKYSTKEMNSDDSFSPIVIEFLSYFFDEQSISWFGKLSQFFSTLNTPKAHSDLTREKRLYHILQDSMFVQPAYALAGQTPQADSATMQEFERLFSLALYVDDRAHTYDACGDYAYDRKYIHNLMEKHGLRRWQENGILSGYTDYSSVYMGFDKFFTNVVSRSHVPYIYTALQVQALFNQLALHHFNRLIESATKEIIDTPKSPIFRRLRKRFITFTNLHWFHELTPKIQGKEIYTRQSQALSLAETYDIVKDKMQQADDYLESEKAIEISKADLKSSRQGAFVTTVGIPIASFALLTNTESIQKTVWDSMTNGLNNICNITLSSNGGMLSYSIIASAIIGYLSFKYLKAPEKKGKKNDN